MCVDCFASRVVFTIGRWHSGPICSPFVPATSFRSPNRTFGMNGKNLDVWPLGHFPIDLRDPWTEPKIWKSLDSKIAKNESVAKQATKSIKQSRFCGKCGSELKSQVGIVHSFPWCCHIVSLADPQAAILALGQAETSRAVQAHDWKIGAWMIAISCNILQ